MLMTYDVLEFSGKIEDPAVHTTLYKPSNKATGQVLNRKHNQNSLTAIIRLKCTPFFCHLRLGRH